MNPEDYYYLSGRWVNSLRKGDHRGRRKTMWWWFQVKGEATSLKGVESTTIKKMEKNQTLGG